MFVSRESLRETVEKIIKFDCFIDVLNCVLACFLIYVFFGRLGFGLV